MRGVRRDGLAAPIDRLVHMLDALLDDMTLRELIDLHINDTVANRTCVVTTNGIANNGTYRVQILVKITLAVDDRVFVLAYVIALYYPRRLFDGQGQTIDTVRSVDRGITPFVLLALRQRIVYMVCRTVQPMERQIQFADRGIQYKMIGRQYYQRQCLDVLASAFRFGAMGISTCILYYRVVLERIRQLVRPAVRQVLIRDTIRAAQVERSIEMHEDFHDTVASVNGLQRLHNSCIFEILLALVTDGCTRYASITMLINRIFRGRPNGELQGEDRIDNLGACFINRIDIRTAFPYVLAAPKDRVSRTSGQLLRILVRLWRRRDDRYCDLIDTVASVDRRVLAAINTVRLNVQTLPLINLSLH